MANVNSGHLGTSIEENLKTEKKPGILEGFVDKLSTEACIKVETKELDQLRLPKLQKTSQSPKICLDENGCGDDYPSIKVEILLDNKPPFEEWTCESLPVVCQKCDIEFGNVRDIIQHLDTQDINTHQGSSILYKCCDTQFLILPFLVLNKYLILHSYSRCHLFHQWRTWHKGELRAKLDNNFLQTCSTSIWNHCGACNESVTDLSSHMKNESHQSSVHIVNTFVKYCKGRAICPIRASAEDINTFFHLVHHNLTPIQDSLQRVWSTLETIQFQENNDKVKICRKIQDHITNLASIDPKTKKPFHFLCYACPQRIYNVGIMLDHIKSVDHQINMSHREQIEIPAFIQCFLCQKEFKDDFTFRLHVFSPHHLSRNAPKNICLPMEPTTENRPMFCFLCQFRVRDKSHFDTPLHVINEQHILGYLEWCEGSQIDPTNPNPETIINYFDSFVQGNVKSLKCKRILEMVDRIQNIACKTRIIHQPGLIEYAQTIDHFHDTIILQESLQGNSKKISHLQEDSSITPDGDIEISKTEKRSNMTPRLELQPDFEQHPYSRVVQSIEAVISCPKCAQTFEHATPLLLHIVSAHKWKVKDFLVDYFEKEVVTCQICLRKCASPMIFALHHDHHQKYKFCSECKKTYINPSQYYMMDPCGKYNVTGEQ